MQKSVRYYITKADDQAVVRSVPVTRPRLHTNEPHQLDANNLSESTKPSVSSLLRFALLRKHDGSQRG